MEIKKNHNKYQIYYRCPNFPKTIYESFDSYEEANLRAAQIELDKKNGTLRPPAKYVMPDQEELRREIMTVRELLDEYVNLYGLNHWSERTLTGTLHRIEHYIVPYIGDLTIKSLTTHKLESFYDQLRSTPAVLQKGRKDTGATVSPSVIEKVHATIRSALNQALRWDYLRGANPAEAVQLPKYKKKKRDVLSDEEAHQALELCTDPVLKLCIFLALGCSMRIGEILGLTWDCVHIEPDLIDSDSAWLYVEKELQRCDKSALEKLRSQGRGDIIFTFPEHKKTGSKTSLVLKAPKTESSVRQIYLPRTIAEQLTAHKSNQELLKNDLADEYQDYNLVVAQNNGRPYETRQIDRKLKDFNADFDLRSVVFHSLRHSSASIKLKVSKGDIKSVQGDTGHAVSNMVTDVYSHIFDANRKHLAKEVDEQFFAAPDNKEAAALPDLTSTQAQAAQLLQDHPQLASTILQIAQVLGGSVSSD